MSSATDLDELPGEIEARPIRRPGDRIRTFVRGIGQTLITVGLVTLLFVVYELWVTDFLSSRAQDQLSEQIEEQWADEPTGTPAEPAPSGPAPGALAPPTPIEVRLGQPFSKMYIPRLGDDWSRVVLEGTAPVQVDQGPGHYIGTALPGEQGNFAVAGHRVGRGSPFFDLDTMQPGDPIIVETSDYWYVYRVLGDPATGSYDGDPSGIPGQQIVLPEAVSVISPTPGGPADGPATGAYLTLTTCTPKYSAAQRLIIHARLDGAPLSKASTPDGPPALLG